MLSALPVLFADAQTTAASPRQGRILELAWRIVGRGDDTCGALVLRGEDEAAAAVGARILRMTGITPVEIAAGASEAQLVEALRAALALAPQAAVIHFAAFEQRFLDDLWMRHEGAPFPLAVICTHAIARRLFPKLPSRSLRAIAGFFGAPVEQMKRAGGHVDATAHIWTRLCQELDAVGITSLPQLTAWLAQKAPRTTGPRQFPIDRALRLALPSVPGVYRMLGASGQVLYVGKATSLNARVNSYFRQRRGLGSPKNEMLTQVVGVEATPCATPLEAALLESDEIKRLAPPYNIALRERTRPLGFFDRSLQPVPADDPAMCIGPLPSAATLEALPVLAAALSGGLASGLLLAALFRDEVAEATLLMGLYLFAKTLPFPAATAAPRRLLAHGFWVARAADAAAADVEKEAEDDEPEAVVQRECTAEDAARALGDIVVQAGRALAKCRRLRRLANATVVFRAGAKKADAWRYVALCGGQLAGAGWTDSPDTAPRVQAGAALGADGRTYDRVRVLSTELNRVADWVLFS